MSRPVARLLGALLAGASLAAVTSALVACGHRPAMCASSRDCGKMACVAGRCQSDAGLPLVESPQVARWTFAPVDLACIGRDDTAPTPLPPYCILGRDDATRIFLRFSVPLPEHADVIEAYVLLSRARRVESDGAILKLHAARVVGEWQGPMLLAATTPPTTPQNTAETYVTWGEVVRVDVRDIVKQWRRRDPDDRGITIEADPSRFAGRLDDAGSPPGTTGTAFAFAPNEDGSERPPSLELYVK